MVDLKIESISGETQKHFDFVLDSKGFIKTESFAQRVLLSLNTWISEFAYNKTTGVDYIAVFTDLKLSSDKIESFVFATLSKDMSDFSTLRNFELKIDEISNSASIGFVAYSTTGQSAEISDFEI